MIVLLRGAGHDAVAAAPSTGVNTVTGEGLGEALDGADVVIDLANSPSFEPSAVMRFFTAHEKNLLAAEVDVTPSDKPPTAMLRKTNCLLRIFESSVLAGPNAATGELNFSRRNLRLRIRCTTRATKPIFRLLFEGPLWFYGFVRIAG